MRTVAWMLLLLVLLIGCSTMDAHAAPHSMFLTTQARRGQEIPGLNRFVDFWHAHGASLNVQLDGRAHFEARTYIWCGPGVKQPCDSSQAEKIISGLKADLQFSRVSGDVAYGTMISGNVQPVGSSETIILLPGDQLLFSAGNVHLCGSAAPV